MGWFSRRRRSAPRTGAASEDVLVEVVADDEVELLDDVDAGPSAAGAAAQRRMEDPAVSALLVAAAAGDEAAVRSALDSLTDKVRAERAARFAPTPMIGVAVNVSPDADGFLELSMAWTTPDVLVTEFPQRLAGVRVVDGDVVASERSGAWSMSRNFDSLASAVRGGGVSAARPWRASGVPVLVTGLESSSGCADGEAWFSVSVTVGGGPDGGGDRVEVVRASAVPAQMSVLLADVCPPLALPPAV